MASPAKGVKVDGYVYICLHWEIHIISDFKTLEISTHTTVVCFNGKLNDSIKGKELSKNLVL